MRVTLNGETQTMKDGANVADALACLGVDPQERGVAVAVDAEVVPRDDWAATRLRDGMRVEVLRAAAGG